MEIGKLIDECLSVTSEKSTCQQSDVSYEDAIQALMTVLRYMKQNVNSGIEFSSWYPTLWQIMRYLTGKCVNEVSTSQRQLVESSPEDAMFSSPVYSDGQVQVVTETDSSLPELRTQQEEETNISNNFHRVEWKSPSVKFSLDGLESDKPELVQKHIHSQQSDGVQVDDRGLYANDIFKTEKYGSRKFICHHCGKAFLLACRLKDHMKIHTGDKPYKCPVCGKSFGWNSCLKSHLALHEDECRFNCHQCDKAYKHKKALQQHQRVCHTGTKPPTDKSFMCSVCGKSFLHGYLLKQHEVAHTKEKPFKCNICGKCFSWKAGLSHHMYKHSSSKIHSCSKCDKQFDHSTQLSRHARTHTGEKPYACTTCGRQFVQSCHLKRHAVVHTGAKPFVCQHCGLSYTQSNSLKIHMNRVHKGINGAS